MKRLVKPTTALLCLPLTFVLLLAGTGVAQAQVFKWVGPDGKVNYGDVPPGPDLKVEKKAFTGNVVDTTDLPFGLADTVKKSPVTLYTGAKCAPCDAGRRLLTARGIPFAEKTIGTNADMDLLGGGEIELPQLAIGTSRQSGFETAAWNARLSAAGYPETGALPKKYRNPPPVAAAPASPARAEPARARSVDASGAPATSAVSTPQSRKQAARAAEAAAPRSEPTIPGLRF